MKYDCLKKIIPILIAVLIFASQPGIFFCGFKGEGLCATPPAVSGTGQQDPKPDIKWFKDQLGIAPKYQEQREGILGMSWAHFLTMVFLVAFFFGALLIYYSKTIKTRRILERLLREEEGKDASSQ